MSFSSEWLALRAGTDARARSADLAARLASHLARHLAGRETMRVLDLGSGTGANLRALAPVLAPVLPRRQHWRLADHDPALLALAAGPADTPVDIERTVADLADPAALDRLFDPAPDLVTASALFDLAGEAWIADACARVAAAGAAFLTVLTYDGRERWQPPCPADGAVLAAFLADQRRDKGLGPAAGPGATEALAKGFAAHGYRVTRARSDWTLAPPRDAALIAALARGITDAVAPALGPLAPSWHDARTGARAVMIGHEDLLALPPNAAVRRQRSPEPSGRR